MSTDAKCGGDNCMGRRVDGVTRWVTEAARDAAVAAERERCARVCEAVHADTGECPEMALHCADRIRAEPPAIPTGDATESSFGEWQEASK